MKTIIRTILWIMILAVIAGMIYTGVCVFKNIGDLSFVKLVVCFIWMVSAIILSFLALIPTLLKLFKNYLGNFR